VHRALVAAAVADELRLMAGWLELDDVEVAGGGDLAPELARVLRGTGRVAQQYT
jgi:hypothetical protein